MTKQNAKVWADALRSGKYSQTQGTLEDCWGFCCLGVCCDLFIPAKKQVFDINGYLFGGHPCEQPNAPKWLKRIEDKLSYNFGQTFAGLNDDHNFTFDEIADIIELIYIYKAF